MRGTPGQQFALVVGAVYVVIGVWGFAETGTDQFASFTDESILVFGVNPLHNVVHLLLGATWLVGSRSAALARMVNLTLGGVLGLVTVLGVIGLLRFLSIESLADPDNFGELMTNSLSVHARAEQRASAVRERRDDDPASLAADLLGEPGSAA